ncbi:MAG: hypothetical protein JJU00_19395 [Opitutales bacterium]|nr:hypothetical protein [Opitutales bacterium]
MQGKERIGAEHILYRDDWLVALDKPPGWAVHRSRRIADARVCMGVLRNLLDRRVHPLHRIDRKTSGIVLFALDAETAREMTARFARREIDKAYLAVVRGWLPGPVLFDAPLAQEKDAEPVPAETFVIPLAQTELPHSVGPHATARYSFLAAFPATGRRHQIRRHLKRAGHPVVGDAVHGDGRHNRFMREHTGTRRMALHAWAVRFRHPVNGAFVRITAALRGDMARMIACLGWQVPDTVPWPRD